MSLICQFCNKEFSSKGNLSIHQKSAKFCLSKRGFVESQITQTQIKCPYCPKLFTSKQMCRFHEEKCNIKTVLQFETYYKLKLDEKDNLLLLKDQETSFLKKQIETLSEDLFYYKDKMYSIILENIRSNNLQTSNDEHKIDISISTENSVEDPTNQIDKLSKENKQYSEKIRLLEKKFIKKNRREDYTQQNVVYIITTEARELKREYKIGKTQDLKKRLSTYNTSEDHKVIFYVECKSSDEMNLLEKFVFIELADIRIRANREWFCGDVDDMIKSIKECNGFINRKNCNNT